MGSDCHEKVNFGYFSYMGVHLIFSVLCMGCVPVQPFAQCMLENTYRRKFLLYDTIFF